MAKVLVLFAHPSLERSEVNLPLFQRALQLEGVTAVDLYGRYPSLRINVNEEQQRLIAHDVIIFMFPLYWYSTPALLKEWQDLVLEYNFAYGPEGHALRGKHFLCAISAGGAAHAYREQGYNHYPIEALLRPLEQTARLCGMHYLAPFTLYESRKAADDGRLTQHQQHWQHLLQALVDNDPLIRLATTPEALFSRLNQLQESAI